MKNIILVLKGFLIGLSLIIPGVSGGTMAIILGVYRRIIDTLSNILKKIRENFFFILMLSIGMGLAILSGAIVLSSAFEHFILPTTLLFVGLIIGGMPMISKKIKPGVKKPLNYLFGILAIALVLIITLCGTGDNKFEEIDVTLIIKLIGLGLIAAATMIIPGISGSLVLMILGYYTAILNVVKDLTNFDNLGYNLCILIPFSIGAILGIVLFSRLIQFLLKNFEVQTFFAIFGFIVASISGIIYQNLTNLSLDVTSFIIQLIIGIVLMVGGAIGTYWLCKFDEKKDIEETNISE